MNFVMNFEDNCQNKIVNFPQLRCLVGISRNNLENIIMNFTILLVCEILAP